MRVKSEYSVNCCLFGQKIIGEWGGIRVFVGSSSTLTEILHNILVQSKLWIFSGKAGGGIAQIAPRSTATDFGRIRRGQFSEKCSDHGLISLAASYGLGNLSI